MRALDLPLSLQLGWYSFIRLGEPELVDFKTRTQFTDDASLNSNPRPVDLQFATLNTRPTRSHVV